MADAQPPPATGESSPPQAADPAVDPVKTVAQAVSDDFPVPQVSESTAATGEEEKIDDQAAIDALLSQAKFDDPSALIDDAALSDASALSLPSFQQVMRDAQVSSIDLLRDVELNVKIELGRSRMLVEDVLKLGEGSVVELDKLAGDPVDVFVNDRLVARGEVLVLNDNFCVRVNEIVAGVKDEGL